MKRSKDFILNQLAGNYVLVPVGRSALDFNGILTLNSTAKFLWEKAEGEFSRETLIEALIKEYGIDTCLANKATDEFIAQMKDAGCVE